MELLLEFLFIIPEFFVDLLCVCGLTANPRKERRFTGEECHFSEGDGGIYLIARRMADLSSEDRKRMIRFNNMAFLAIASGAFAIGIITMALMSAVSGWFWILGIAAEIIMAVWAYGRWKKKALAMTAKA